MKRTTKQMTATFLARAVSGATKSWAPGDACQSFKGGATTTVKEVRGESVFLADGTSGHVSRMRPPVEA